MGARVWKLGNGRGFLRIWPIFFSHRAHKDHRGRRKKPNEIEASKIASATEVARAERSGVPLGGTARFEFGVLLVIVSLLRWARGNRSAFGTKRKRKSDEPGSLIFICGERWLLTVAKSM